MCIFSRHVELVAATKIFARALPDGRQARIEVDVPVVAWTDPTAHTIGILGAEVGDGLQLAQVQPRGAAAAAGFAAGDVVTTVDGLAVAELSPFGAWLFSNRAPGSTVKLVVTRAGKRIAADVVLRSI